MAHHPHTIPPPHPRTVLLHHQLHMELNSQTTFLRQNNVVQEIIILSNCKQ